MLKIVGFINGNGEVSAGTWKLAADSWSAGPLPARTDFGEALHVTGVGLVTDHNRRRL